MTRLHNDWIPAEKWSACGANVSLRSDSPAWRRCLDRAVPRLFPPGLVVKIKALACELPARHRQPLARWSVPELTRYIRETGLVASISDSTLWRWLHADAIRPWQHRCWIFPRNPDFEIKAGRLLDLYERKWEGRPLGKNDFVISADEKTSIQARARIHPTLPPRPHQPMKVEHEYKRRGAWAYLAHGTCIAQKSSAAANTKAGSHPLTGWSNKS
jgi:hypothetical protein